MPRRLPPTVRSAALAAPAPEAVAAPAPAVPFDRPAARASLARLASQAAATEGLELAWLDAPLEGRNWLVKVVVERADAAGAEGGVSLGECARVSEHLSVLLDIEDPVQHAYTLEVSSPGLDRPLFTPADFRRFTGRLAAVITTERILNQTFLRGHILSAEESATESAESAGGAIVSLKLEGGKTAAIPYHLIKKANLEVEF